MENSKIDIMAVCLFSSSKKLERFAHTKTTLGNSIDNHYQNCDLQVTNTLFKKRKEIKIKR